MADDKTKRFRVHVVKELYETEKDYTEHLEFTVTVRWQLAVAASCEVLLVCMCKYRTLCSS